MGKNGVCRIPTTSGSLRPVLARTTVAGRNRLPWKRVVDLDKSLCQKAGRKEGRVQKAKPCRLQLLSWTLTWELWTQGRNAEEEKTVALLLRWEMMKKWREIWNSPQQHDLPFQLPPCSQLPALSSSLIWTEASSVTWVLRAQVREPQQSLFYSSYVWSSEKARQIYKSTTGQKQTYTRENDIEGWLKWWISSSLFTSNKIALDQLYLMPGTSNSLARKNNIKFLIHLLGLHMSPTTTRKPE